MNPNFFRMEALLFTYVIDIEYIYRIVVLNVEGNCTAQPKHKIKCPLLSNRTDIKRYIAHNAECCAAS